MRSPLWQLSFGFDHEQALQLCPLLVRVHVGEEFGGRDSPTASGFDAAVVLFYRLVVVVGDISESVFFLQREHCLNSFMQLWLILFERQNVVSAALCNLLRNRFLTADRID